MVKIETHPVGGDNLGYLISDKGQCTIVDPGMDPSRILDRMDKEGLELEYIILTHHHSDHTASLPEVRRRAGGRTAASRYCAESLGGADMILIDGDVLELNDTTMEIIHTPGHTPGSICLLVDGKDLFTGDTLFIDDCGRCDLPGGSLEDMFRSMRRIRSLPDGIMVRPGHDYGSRVADTLGNQKRANPCLLAGSLEELSRI